MSQTVNWKVDSETLTFKGDCNGYQLTISSGVHNAAVWGSVVRRGWREFRGKYDSVPDAMIDLTRRASTDYFVTEDDPRFTENYENPETKEDVVSAPDQPDEKERRDHVVTLFKNAEGKYEWVRKAGNGELVSDSANHGYIHKRDALHGLRLANQDTNYRLVDNTGEGENE